MELAVLYRGPLESCNYGCTYCPFAKKVDEAATLAADRAALARFVAWIAARPPGDRLSVLFTPWGEGLARAWYQEAMVELSRLPSITRVAIQTNLSVPLAWTARADATKAAVWATYHPDWTTRERFVAKVSDLRARGLAVSCGVVGFRRFFGEIEALRRALPGDVYLWVNAAKGRWDEGYADAEIAQLLAIDPHFSDNLRPHASRGEPCRAGAAVVSVDGEGTVRRCHFVRTPLGNLYLDRIEDLLAERPCPNDTCGCHIGYVHLDRLGLHEVYGDGVLERIPRRLPVLSGERREDLPLVDGASLAVQAR
ncbi:MAG: STM4011 family radical SAM protein [Myxococcales bacterium]|nr:STM4011 family radical SAM protein [Myxococcales bacterium]